MSDFGALVREVRGLVILPGDPAYESARRVWNGMIDRRPLAIVRCAQVADVVAAIQFASSEGLVVAVRGGGHNVAGNAVCDGGLVIDLGGMKQIEVDAKGRRVRAEGGVVWGELDAAAQPHGLATTGGLVPSTGIAGFTLGGGLGNLMRSYGLACDNLVSAQLVTAAGRVLSAGPGEESDLFWGLRGGGGNFGVVTSFEFELHPVGRELPTAVVGHPLARAREALRFYREFSATAPDRLTVYANLARPDPGTPRIGIRAVFNGPLEEGEPVLRQLLAFGVPEVSDLQPRPYVELQRLLEPMFPAGRLNYWKANFLAELGDELIEILVDGFQRAPSPHSMVVLEPMGGAVARVGKTDTAFEHRNAAYSLLILAGWEDPAGTEANVAWARELWERTRPFSTGGVYVNYLGVEGDDRVRDAYGLNHPRLAALKERYDPANFFHLNQNIRGGRSRVVSLWDANIPSRVNQGTHYVPSTDSSGTLSGDHKGERLLPRAATACLRTQLHHGSAIRLHPIGKQSLPPAGRNRATRFLTKKSGGARFPVVPQAVEHLREGLVGMCAHDQVAAAEDVGRYCVDPRRLRLVAAVVKDHLVAALHNRKPQLDRIKPYPRADTHEIVDILEPASPLPVSHEQRPMHLVELALLAGELSGAQRPPRVDDHVALPHHKSHLGRDGFEATTHLLRASAPEVSLERDPLDRRLGMELERKPRQVNEAFLLQAFDSDRVDVTPGSDVVGEDDQILGRDILNHRSGRTLTDMGSYWAPVPQRARQ